MITAKAYEQSIYKAYKAAGLLVTRFDYKNKMPDFLVVGTDGVAFGVECKRYLSCKTKREAMQMWRRKQPTQVAAFKKLKKQGLSIEMALMLKGGKELFFEL